MPWMPVHNCKKPVLVCRVLCFITTWTMYCWCYACFSNLHVLFYLVSPSLLVVIFFIAQCNPIICIMIKEDIKVSVFCILSSSSVHAGTHPIVFCSYVTGLLNGTLWWHDWLSTWLPQCSSRSVSKVQTSIIGSPAYDFLYQVETRLDSRGWIPDQTPKSGQMTAAKLGNSLTKGPFWLYPLFQTKIFS